MNKLLLTTTALVLGLAFTADAWADCNGVYLGLRGGVVKHKLDNPESGGTANGNDDFDKNRFMMSGALGYRYNYVRTELEYIWRNKVNQTLKDEYNDRTRQEFKTESYMLNAYIDFAPFHWITPYVGGGIGYTKLKYSSSYPDTVPPRAGENYNKKRFTWSVGGGLSVKVTNRFNVDAGYRYYDMGDIKHDSGEKTGVKAHEVYGGVRYVF